LRSGSPTASAFAAKTLRNLLPRFTMGLVSALLREIDADEPGGIMRYTIAGWLAVTFALASLAIAPCAAASPDDDFLAELSSSGLSFPPHATLGVINGGHSVCQSFAKGASYKETVADVTRGLGGNQSLAGSFVQAATSTLCPKYGSNLP
jgi:Protein of unknown function (DUF732)